jgi:hypothetical protein
MRNSSRFSSLIFASKPLSVATVAVIVVMSASYVCVVSMTTPARSSIANWSLVGPLVVVMAQAFAGIVVAALSKRWGNLVVS